MKKRNFLNGASARLALAIVAFTGVLLTGCYKDDGLDVNGGVGNIVLPPAVYTLNGTIIDANTGTAIDDAVVTVTPNTSLKTNGNTFTAAVAPGDVTIKITAANYRDIERTIKIEKINAGQIAIYSQLFPMSNTSVNPDESFSAKVSTETTATTSTKEVNVANETNESVTHTINYSEKTGSSFNETVESAVSKAGFTNEAAQNVEIMIFNYLVENGYADTGIKETETNKEVTIPAQSIFKSYDITYTTETNNITFSVFKKEVYLTIESATKTLISTNIVPIDHGHGHGDGLAGGGIVGAE